MSGRHRICGLCAAVVAACAILASASRARAEVVGQITVTATQQNLTDSFTFAWQTSDDPATYLLSAPEELRDGTTLLGTIKSLQVDIDQDPGVQLKFAVDANASLTTFTITSSTVSFSPLVNPLAFASAGVTVTDNDSDGATVTGLEPGAKAYRAFYNGSTDWAYLVAPVVAGTDTTNTVNDRQPAGNGRLPIINTVSSITSEFKFTLTANDSASGTSRFDVQGNNVPEPASLGVLGIGSLLALRRRRA